MILLETVLCVFQDSSVLAGGNVISFQLHMSSENCSSYHILMHLPDIYIDFTPGLCREVSTQADRGRPLSLLPSFSFGVLSLRSFLLSSTYPQQITGALASLTLNLCSQLIWMTRLLWVPFPAPWPGNCFWAISKGNFRAFLIYVPSFRITVLYPLLSSV